mgnify:CR=1 FL=1
MKKTVVRRIGAVVVATALLFSLGGCPCLFGGAVFFPDAALESAVRNALDKPFGCISKSELLEIVELQAAGLQIRDLEGLQYCKSLTTLNLRSNKIQSISQLAGLKDLTWVHLGDNVITNIEPLAGLLRLDYLNLFGDANEVYAWKHLVANAQAGGLGLGSTVVLPTRTTLNEDDTIRDDFEGAYNALINAGVTVIFAEPDGTEIEF